MVQGPRHRILKPRAERPSSTDGMMKMTGRQNSGSDLVEGGNEQLIKYKVRILYDNMEEMLVVNAPKDYVYQIRMNSEVKKELEEIYAKCGVTLSDALNIFMQQSLNVGGFPFPVVPDQTEARRKEAARYLTASYRRGLESVREQGGWIPADEAERMLEEDQ